MKSAKIAAIATQTHRQWCVRISGEMHERDNPCDCGKATADALLVHIDTLTMLAVDVVNEFRFVERADKTIRLDWPTDEYSESDPEIDAKVVALRAFLAGE